MYYPLIIATDIHANGRPLTPNSIDMSRWNNHEAKNYKESSI